MSKDHDTYFIENNLVYRRFLALMRHGAYLQINQDRASCTEADEGTWDQTADGTLLLHSSRHALRFRALLRGPLTILLDSHEKREALLRLATAIRRFLAATGDTVFQIGTLADLNAPPAAVTANAGAETYSRHDLESLLREVEDTMSADATGIYTFTPVRSAGIPPLLLLKDAVFQMDDLVRVTRAYHVKPGDPPPFYFAQVSAGVFVREVGVWQKFRYLGGTD